MLGASLVWFGVVLSRQENNWWLFVVVLVPDLVVDLFLMQSWHAAVEKNRLSIVARVGRRERTIFEGADVVLVDSGPLLRGREVVLRTSDNSELVFRLQSPRAARSAGTALRQLVTSSARKGSDQIPNRHVIDMRCLVAHSFESAIFLVAFVFAQNGSISSLKWLSALFLIGSFGRLAFSTGRAKW